MYPDLDEFKDCLSDLKFSGLALRRHETVPYYLQGINPFISDEARIDNCMALKLLEGKAQVFPEPQNPLVRNRISHTREAKNIAVILSDFLGLNTDLCRAIMLGHDIGHAPFGHGGEAYIPTLEGNGKVFEHQKFGVIVAQAIEDPRWKGASQEVLSGDALPQGLNLTFPTLEGILLHSTNTSAMDVDENKPQEYALCMYADKIAYTFADVDDAIQLEKLKYDGLRDALGTSRIFDFDTMSHEELQSLCERALIVESSTKGYVSFCDSPVAKEFAKLRDFMYAQVYNKIVWDQQRQQLDSVYGFLKEDTRFTDTDSLLLLSLLADRQVDSLAEILKRQEKVKDSELKKLGIYKLMPYVKNQGIDYSKADLHPSEFIYA